MLETTALFGVRRQSEGRRSRAATALSPPGQSASGRGLPLHRPNPKRRRAALAAALEGTFDAVISHLDRLKELGVTAIELMPVAQFPGSRNWGYDGVYPFAPKRRRAALAAALQNRR